MEPAYLTAQAKFGTTAEEPEQKSIMQLFKGCDCQCLEESADCSGEAGCKEDE